MRLDCKWPTQTRHKVNHPRHITALNETNHRLCRSSWRREATGLVRPTPLDNVEREPLPNPFFKPWLDEPCTNLEYDTAKETTVETIAAKLTVFSPDITIYTDGSCKDGVRDGGAAAVITEGPVEDPLNLHVIKERGSRLTCSYEEEKRTLHLSIQ